MKNNQLTPFNNLMSPDNSYCFLPFTITDSISAKNWRRLKTSFQVEKFPSLLNIISNVRFTNSKPSKSRYFKDTPDDDKLFFEKFPYLLLIGEENSFLTATLVLLCCQNITVNEKLLSKAKKFLKEQQHKIEVPSWIYLKLLEAIPDLFCPEVKIFQIKPYNPSWHSDFKFCKKCNDFVSLNKMGAVTGKRLTCSNCFPKNGNSVLQCTFCYCYFPNFVKHQCTSLQIWTCKGCFNNFQTEKLPNNLCDHCFLHLPPFETTNNTLSPNECVILPKSTREIITKCSICYQNSSNLELLCTNYKCFAVGCESCFNKWFKQKGPGFEFLVSKTRCPFCKHSPNFTGLVHHIRDDIAIGKTLDLNKRYASCLSCFTVLPIEQRCSDDQEIVDYICDICQNWESDEQSPKICPSCGVCVEKIGGCDHITCSNCRSHWCYRCRVKLDPQMGLYNHKCKINHPEILNHPPFTEPQTPQLQQQYVNRRIFLFLLLVTFFTPLLIYRMLQYFRSGQKIILIPNRDDL